MAARGSVFPFLQLPRELHLDTSDGYIYDFDKNKLLHANGDRINLSLSTTCHQISSEIAGLAFEANEVTFRTFSSRDTMYRAARFEKANRTISNCQSIILNELAPRFLTTSAASIAANSFPMFQPLLERWQSGKQVPLFTSHGVVHGTLIPWGEPRSSWVDFNCFVLSLISKDPGFLEEAERVVDTWPKDGKAWRADAMGILDARPVPWAIHGLDEVSRLQSLVAPVDWVSRDRFLDEFGLHHRYSAASLAIRFLQSFPHVAFSQIKKITLLEDHLSIANSPSHAQGLIRFCRQNPGLQIERVVDLWRAGLSPDDFPELPLRTHIITKSFGRWIFEALELRKRGMPGGSFRLILDGSPLPEKASQVFEAVKRDAARQAARDLCYARNILPCPSWFQRRNRVAYQWEGLHQAITSLQNGDYASFIDCNFDLGAAHDPECIIDERLDWTADDWTENELAHMRQQFDTEAPLPPWQELHPICIID